MTSRPSSSSDSGNEATENAPLDDHLVLLFDRRRRPRPFLSLSPWPILRCPLYSFSLLILFRPHHPLWLGLGIGTLGGRASDETMPLIAEFVLSSVRPLIAVAARQGGRRPIKQHNSFGGWPDRHNAVHFRSFDSNHPVEDRIGNKGSQRRLPRF